MTAADIAKHMPASLALARILRIVKFAPEYVRSMLLMTGMRSPHDTMAGQPRRWPCTFDLGFRKRGFSRSRASLSYGHADRQIQEAAVARGFAVHRCDVGVLQRRIRRHVD